MILARAPPPCDVGVLLPMDRFGARAARAAPGGLLEDMDG